MITLGDTDYTTSKDSDRPRDRAPVVRRPGHADRLARPLDERGHGDVPPARLAGRGHRRRRSTRSSSRSRRTRARVAPGQRAAGGLRPEDVRRDPGVLRPRADVGRRSAAGSATRRSGRWCAPGRRTTPTAAATATSTSPGSRSRPAPSCPTCSTAGCWRSARRGSLVRGARSARRPSLGSPLSAESLTDHGRRVGWRHADPGARRQRVPLQGGGGGGGRPRSRGHVRDARAVGRGARRGPARGVGPRRRRTGRPRRRGLRRGRRRLARSRRTCARRSPPGRTRTGCSSRRSTSTPTTRRPTPAPTARSSTRSTRTATCSEDPEAYGAMKVSCENAVHRRRRAVDGGAARADRRPRRPDRPLRLLARAAGRRRPRCSRPADPADRVQLIDVRDLAEWIVRMRRGRHDRRLRRHRTGHAGGRGARADGRGRRRRRRSWCGRARSS